METAITKDPQRFENSNEMGEVRNNFGNIELDIWRQVIDLSTRQPTGRLKRERMRTSMEVFRDLNAALQFQICDACGIERKQPEQERKDRVYSPPHMECMAETRGEWQDAVDEYFTGPDTYNGGRPNVVIPHNYRRIASFPVVGGSEGWYWHVGVLYPGTSSTDECYPPLQYAEIAFGKTFRGWDHCCRMANKCAELLGA